LRGQPDSLHRAALVKLRSGLHSLRMDTIPTARAQRELPDLIHRAAGGETIILEAPSGERVRLEPVAEPERDRVPGLLKGKIGVPARLLEPMTAEELKLWYGEDD